MSKGLQYQETTNQKQSNLIAEQYFSDQQFFNSLEHYRPLCYKGQGTPIFMINDGWQYSLICILICDALMIAALVLFIISFHKDSQKRTIMIILTSVLIVLTNVLYLLTQFLNPGIVNPSTISNQQYVEEGKVLCQYCNRFRTSKMKHCKFCKVCIRNIDHHCGFFNKCIAGGCQTLAFYGLMISVMGGMCCMILCFVFNAV